MNTNKKHYIGAGVYLEINADGYVEISTSNGITTSNKIVLEQDTYEEMVRIVTDLRRIKTNLDTNFVSAVASTFNEEEGLAWVQLPLPLI